jgi:hypothetical protein
MAFRFGREDEYVTHHRHTGMCDTAESLEDWLCHPIPNLYRVGQIFPLHLCTWSDNFAHGEKGACASLPMLGTHPLIVIFYSLSSLETLPPSRGLRPGRGSHKFSPLRPPSVRLTPRLQRTMIGLPHLRGNCRPFSASCPQKEVFDVVKARIPQTTTHWKHFGKMRLVTGR